MKDLIHTYTLKSQGIVFGTQMLNFVMVDCFNLTNNVIIIIIIFFVNYCNTIVLYAKLILLHTFNLNSNIQSRTLNVRVLIIYNAFNIV